MSRKAAARVNRILLERCFSDEEPIDVPLDNHFETFYSYKGIPVMVSHNLDKATRVVNGQLVTIVNNQGRTLILQLPNKKQTFT